MNHQEHSNKKNHDKHPDESKTRTHRFSKLPDDGDPWAPNNLLTPEQKKNISWTPVGVSIVADDTDVCFGAFKAQYLTISGIV